MPRGADFKNTGLDKSTPSGTVCLGGGLRLGPCGPLPTGVVWAGPYTKRKLKQFISKKHQNSSENGLVKWGSDCTRALYELLTSLTLAAHCKQGQLTEQLNKCLLYITFYEPALASGF